MITSCSQTTGQCFPWTMNNRKLTDIKHFFLPFMLFEACGAVFIMNSKINLRKLAWGSISVISHHFPVYSLSGSTTNRCMRPSFSSLLSLKFFSRSFGVKSSTARISSHFSTQGHYWFAARCYLGEILHDSPTVNIISPRMNKISPVDGKPVVLPGNPKWTVTSCWIASFRVVYGLLLGNCSYQAEIYILNSTLSH